MRVESVEHEQTGTRIPTLPALDGIRALAIAAVVTYHGDIYWVPGGLLGVEVFFVLSGYLITSLLWSELKDTRSIGFGTFLKRRARRLLPAVFVMLALVSAAFVIWHPEEVGRIRGDVAAAATYTSNWYLIGTDHSYFSTFARPSPFGHLWSLAIEEQFYLIWPPLLFLLWKIFRRPRRVAIAIGAGAAASVAALVLLYEGGDPSRIYYGTDTRAAGLLIGAALAVLWRPFAKAPEERKAVRPLWLDAATVASIGFLVFAFMRFDDLASFTYRPGLLLVSLATALLIASAVHPDARIAKLFGTAPLRWLGKRSYSVYIWYFPVFALARPGVDYDVTIGTAFAIRVAATITLAELSYRFVEQPIRNGALGRLYGRLKERVREPHLDGRRFVLRLSGAGLVATLLIAALTIEMVQAPLLAAKGPRSAPIAGIDWIEPIDLFPPTASVADRPVIAIGDSVMVGARDALRDRFSRIVVDARVARQVAEGIARLEAYRDAGRLGRVVVIHLGNNGRFTTPQFELIMRVLAKVERVLFLNVKVPRRWEAANNHVISDGIRRHPGHAVLVSWRRLARESCPGRVFGPDGTHVTDAGARCYARIIAASASPS
ncbi:MAG: acyltransferase family protein [Actinomycetota bacterium]